MDVEHIITENTYLRGYIAGLHAALKIESDVDASMPVISVSPVVTPEPVVQEVVEQKRIAGSEVITIPAHTVSGIESLRNSSLEITTMEVVEERVLTEEQEKNRQRLLARVKGTGPIIEEIDGKVNKLCPHCFEFKEIDTGWYKRNNRRDGLSIYCIDCSRADAHKYVVRDNLKKGLPTRSYYRGLNNDKPPNYKRNAPTQVCDMCHLSKPKKEFRRIRFSDMTWGRAAYCVECEENKSKRALQAVMQENATA